MKIKFLQKLLQWGLVFYLKSFRHKLECPKNAQLHLLKKLVKDLARTEYGQFLGILGTETLEEFQSQVPCVEYSDLEPWIQRQRLTTDPVVVSAPVLFYEKTSGSSGPSKYIPYSKNLKTVFGKMACLWIGDILTNGPRFSTGKIFMSVSPAFGKEVKTDLGVAIGLEDDSDYLPAPVQLLISAFLVNPFNIKKLSNPTDYRWVLCCALLAAEGLEIVSIWNPSYFTALLDFICKYRFQMAEDLRSGKVLRGGLRFNFYPVSRDRLNLILSDGNRSAVSQNWRQIWPSLKWISCWADAGARPFAKELKALFPGVLFQGKGLLATESPLTFPLVGMPYPVPLVDQVFFEFIDDQGQIKLLHQLEDQTEYEVVVSPLGGFMRYRLGDRVRTQGQVGNTPSFEFVGRGTQVSDLVGEKLNEIFVRESLSKCSAFQGFFYFLLPVREARPPYYALVLSDQRSDQWSGQRSDLRKNPSGVSGRGCEAQGKILETLLCLADHYRYARQMEQLGPTQIWRLSQAQDLYYGYYIQRGMKWGDIKFSTLISSGPDADGLSALCASQRFGDIQPSGYSDEKLI